MYKSMGSIRGRHDMPVEDYFYDFTVDRKKPFLYFQYEIKNKVARIKHEGYKGLKLYCTGYQPLQFEIIKWCHYYKLSLVIMHHDPKFDQYDEQPMFKF